MSNNQLSLDIGTALCNAGGAIAGFGNNKKSYLFGAALIAAGAALKQTTNVHEGGC